MREVKVGDLLLRRGRVEGERKREGRGKGDGRE